MSGYKNPEHYSLDDFNFATPSLTSPNGDMFAVYRVNKPKSLYSTKYASWAVVETIGTIGDIPTPSAHVYRLYRTGDYSHWQYFMMWGNWYRVSTRVHKLSSIRYEVDF